jgi:hypothetical protein
MFINYKGHFTLFHEIFKSLSQPQHLIQEDVNSYPEFISCHSSKEEDWSILVNYKRHFTLVHEIFKSLSETQHLIQEDVNSYPEYISCLSSKVENYEGHFTLVHESWVLAAVDYGRVSGATRMGVDTALYRARIGGFIWVKCGVWCDRKKALYWVPQCMVRRIGFGDNIGVRFSWRLSQGPRSFRPTSIRFWHMWKMNIRTVIWLSRWSKHINSKWQNCEGERTPWVSKSIS